MKNLIQRDGDAVDVIAPTGGVTAGLGIIIGDMFGVPAVDAAEGETFALWVTGVWGLAKKSGTAWTAGQTIWWDTSEEAAHTSGDKIIGAAPQAVASDATTGAVRLNGTFGFAQS